MNQPRDSVKLELLVQRKVQFLKTNTCDFFNVIGESEKWQENCYHVVFLPMLPTCLKTYSGWPRVRSAVTADSTYVQISISFASCAKEGQHLLDD